MLLHELRHAWDFDRGAISVTGEGLSAHPTVRAFWVGETLACRAENFYLWRQACASAATTVRTGCRARPSGRSSAQVCAAGVSRGARPGGQGRVP